MYTFVLVPMHVCIRQLWCIGIRDLLGILHVTSRLPELWIGTVIAGNDSAHLRGRKEVDGDDYLSKAKTHLSQQHGGCTESPAELRDK